MSHIQTPERLIALIDCDNFFVSCERAFNPSLYGCPVVVLSSNDGCIVARSQEVKALKVPMGVPIHQYRDLLKRHHTYFFSSNFQLYSDMSRRMNQILNSMLPQVESYSIDEAFTYFNNLGLIYIRKLLKQVKNELWQCLSLPVSIGLSTSRVLAKLATTQAKKSEQGFFELVQNDHRKELLSATKVGEIWGVSKGTQLQLKAINIQTARQLTDANLALVRAHLGVRGINLIMQLNGHHIKSRKTNRKSFLSSHSFGQPIKRYQDLERMMFEHIDAVCKKMRRNKMLALELKVFSTSKNSATRKTKRSLSMAVVPTCEVAALMEQARLCLKQLYQPDYIYFNVGVCVSKLILESEASNSLLEQRSHKKEEVEKLVDLIQKKMGNDAIFYGSQVHSKKPWQPRAQLRSPSYTSRWDQLLEVYAG